MSSSLQKKAGGGFILVIIIGAWGYFFLLVAPYEKGKEAFEQGKYEEAISFLSEVKKGERRYTKAQSLIVEAKFEKGKEAFRQSKYEEAISLFLLTTIRIPNFLFVNILRAFFIFKFSSINGIFLPVNIISSTVFN